MFIDILLGIVLLLGLIIGYNKGIIHSVFSLVGWLLGALIAIKWSHNISLYLQQHLGHHRWMPFVTFLLVFISVIIIVQLLSKLLEKSFSTVGLDFVNKAIGGVLWCMLLVFVLSVLLWFAEQLHWIDADLKKASYTYDYIAPIAPFVIYGFGKVVPWFKDAFEHLQQLITNNTPAVPGN